MRRAVDEFVIEKLLVRKHGSGTYTTRPKVARWLGVISFTRLRLADEMPMVVERTTVPGSYVPGLSAGDLEGSLYELLLQRYCIELVSGTSTLEPTMPDNHTAEWLEISTSQPCLLASGVSFDDRQRVFEYTTAVYRGDRYSFTAELRMAPPTRKS